MLDSVAGNFVRVDAGEWLARAWVVTQGWRKLWPRRGVINRTPHGIPDTSQGFDSASMTSVATPRGSPG